MRILGLAVGALLSCVASFAQAQSSLPVVEPAPGTPVGAEPSPLRPLLTMDEARDWRAVGRLDTGSSFCSGTLIAPDLVLTAAHCAFHPETGAPLEAADLVFSAGLRNGRADAVRTVERVILPPRYRLPQGANLDMIGRDLALMELQHAVTGGITPIPTSRGLAQDDLVTVVSYGQDREGHASIEEGCHVLERADTVRALDCSIVPGSSGAPVVQILDGAPRVVAVVSAVGHTTVEDGGGEAEVALAVTLDDLLSTLLALRVREGAFGLQTSSTTFLNQETTGRTTIGGARFIRP